MRLRQINLKIDRASEHAAAARAEIDSYLNSNPFTVTAKRDPVGRRLVYYVDSVGPIPDRIALLAGDAIQNLMSALDHLAYQLVCVETDDNPPNPGWIYFPIADSQTLYESKKRGKMNGAAEATFGVIDALQPYKGGDDAIWMLYRLNNIEKHRLLLTVGSQAAGIHLGQMMAPLLSAAFPQEAVKALESMNFFLNPADKGFPLTPGFELYITAPDEEINPKLQFRFSVALNEPGIVDGAPLLETLDGLVATVHKVTAALTPRLR